MPDLNSFAVSTNTHTDDYSHAILNLDDDVLWYIFSINADMEHDTEGRIPALFTLRYTSQVCSRWRELTIGSPSLWARILNVNLLSQTGTDWKEEVIRRTGTALLHVKALSKLYQPRWSLRRDSLKGLLKPHWSRIRRLDLEFYSLPFLVCEEPWQRLFERQASSLEILKIMFSLPSPHVANPIFTLSSDITPILRTLSVAYTGLDFSTLRTPSLRNLDIGSPVSALDLLSALGHMPLLEVLQASRLESGLLAVGMNAPNPLPTATLPHLTTVKFRSIDGGVDSSLCILAHITPAKGCTLHFFGAYSDETPDYEQALSVLSTYLQNYTACSAATTVEIRLVPSQIIFRLDNSSFGHFSFGLDSGSTDKDIAFHSLALSTVGLGGVKILTLSLSKSDAQRPDVIKFIHSLVSIEVLKADLCTLDYFLDTLLSPGIIALPALKSIYLECQWQLDRLEIVTNFINTRIEWGFPPDELTLRQTKPVKHSRFFLLV
ncbi:hypothetical protein GALMADRAFT_136160 [Galerina marginata CBS 339.88]|uniref:F-box domain-containing protein n=1 Tax=Galerina marginata (strain CBS 339.88) TaxID=685588 RepID=A0A067TFH7_GALM3|nr:hypothetical protein GALMADRAFT_136160 [Galerina marginata CBS 339.88]